MSLLSDPKKRLKNSIYLSISKRSSSDTKIVFRLPFIPLFKKLTISLAKEAKKHKNGYNNKMIISVKAKPNSPAETVEKTGETVFEVAVREPPVAGRANAAIVKALAEYFGVPVFKVKIISGRTSRNKLVKIDN